MTDAAIKRLEAVSEKNTTSISELTNQVVRIATIVENAEKRHGDDLLTIKDAISSVNKLSEKVSQALLLEKDFMQQKETIADLKSVVKVAENNITTLQQDNTQNKFDITSLQKSNSELKAKVEALEVIRDRMAGAGEAVSIGAKILWTLFGGGVTTLAIFLLTSFFNGHAPKINIDNSQPVVSAHDDQ